MSDTIKGYLRQRRTCLRVILVQQFIYAFETSGFIGRPFADTKENCCRQNLVLLPHFSFQFRCRSMAWQIKPISLTDGGTGGSSCRKYVIFIVSTDILKLFLPQVVFSANPQLPRTRPESAYTEQWKIMRLPNQRTIKNLPVAPASRSPYRSMQF